MDKYYNANLQGKRGSVQQTLPQTQVIFDNFGQIDYILVLTHLAFVKL